MSLNVQYINGQWLAGSGSTFSSLNPSDNSIIWQGNAASEEQVDMAIKSARDAFNPWSDLSENKRICILNNFATELKNNTEEFAIIIAKETGKALWESKSEVATMVGKIVISIKANQERTGTTENIVPGGKAFIRHKPHGVVAIFGPYNFPGHLPNGHIVPALLAGNTVVYKPSELSPKVAEFTVRLWQQAGLPDGVINLIQGEVETGKALASHSDLDGLFFTGSSNTGHLLHKQFAGQPGKILALEMGGNNPIIVKNVADAFAQPQPFIGSMISESAALGMLKAQREIKALGGKSLIELKHLTKGTGFVSPGIIDVTHAKALPDEEHFGPLLKVYRYTDFDKAIAEANNTSFGLSSGLLADEKDDYHYFFKNIRAGIVNWNKPTTGASSAAPFGGIGASGNHRSSAYYAADYCAYPVASIESEKVVLPTTLSPGLSL